MTRLAVIGSGPAAFYTLARVLQRIPTLNVSMFEKSYFPFGLTRYGVAPDHPEVKSCQERFSQMVSEVGEGKFKFYGNVEVGKDVKLETLNNSYDAVLIASGAQRIKKLGIEGEDLKGVVPARDFVNWYNGDPAPSFDPALLQTSAYATVIGNGNVALDIARMLLTSRSRKRWSEIEFNDLASPILSLLARSTIHNVSVVGRKGLMQSAFTNKEFREIVNLEGVSMLPVDPASELQIEPQNRIEKRKLAILNKYDYNNSKEESCKNTWQLKFWRTPTKFIGDKRVEAVEYKTKTGDVVVEPADLVFTSIGYKGMPIPGLQNVGAEFNELTGNLERENGKVVGTDHVFASGWISTGAHGAIASTMRDSFDVGDKLADYLSNCNPADANVSSGEDAVANDLRNSKKRVVTWHDWKNLDSEELRRGDTTNKGREKFISEADILSFLNAENHKHSKVNS